MLQNNIAANGALHTRWSTAGIQSLKMNNSIKLLRMFLSSLHPTFWLVSRWQHDIFTCEHQTSKEISSLKINYMHLCPDSHHVQVFVSVSQNTFSQCLILLFWSQFTHSFWSQWQKSSEEKHQSLKTIRTVAEPNFGWVIMNSIAF